MLRLVRVVCCHVEVSATSQSLNQTSITKCGASECNLETSTMKRPRLTMAVEPCKKRKVSYNKDQPFRYAALNEWFYNRREDRLLSSRN